MESLHAEDLLAAGLDDWRKLAQALHGRWATESLAAGAAFVEACGDETEHLSEVRLSSSWVELRVCTRDGGWWVTPADVEVARRISTIAAQHGLRPDPASVVQVEIGLDSAAIAMQGPFWAALLSGDAAKVTRGEVLDEDFRFPNLWFQPTDAHAVPRQRFHLDVWVAPEVAEQRIAAAVAAGGRVVSTDEQPAFTLLADPEGNRVCVCTYLGR